MSTGNNFASLAPSPSLSLQPINTNAPTSATTTATSTTPTTATTTTTQTYQLSDLLSGNKLIYIIGGSLLLILLLKK